MAMAFSFLDCYCDHSFEVSKWHAGVLLSLVGAPFKDWYDEGLKFWFEEIFFLVCERCQDLFQGVAKIGWDFLDIGIWSSA